MASTYTELWPTGPHGGVIRVGEKVADEFGGEGQIVVSIERGSKGQVVVTLSDDTIVEYLLSKALLKG